MIEPGDILFVHTDFDLGGEFTFEVDVTGLLDEQIAVFVAGTGVQNPSCDPYAVPATSRLGVVALALALLAASYRRLRTA